MMASSTDSVASEALDEFNYGNEATADDEVFQRQMRATAKVRVVGVARREGEHPVVGDCYRTITCAGRVRVVKRRRT